MRNFYDVGDTVIINWSAVKADGAFTEDMEAMEKNETPTQVYKIARVDSTEAYPYILEGYETITSFDDDELFPANITSENLFENN